MITLLHLRIIIGVILAISYAFVKNNYVVIMMRSFNTIITYYFVIILTPDIIQLFGHCIATWYAMTWSLVKLTEIETSCGRG